MKIIQHLLTLILFSAIVCISHAQTPFEEEPREFEMTEGDTTYTMKRYVMVMLLRNDDRPDIPEEEIAKLQQGHMDNINRLAEEGKLVLAGPFGDDTELRGIFILDVGTIEEAEELVATDPAIKAERMKVEFHPWWGAKGTVLR